MKDDIQLVVNADIPPKYRNKIIEKVNIFVSKAGDVLGKTVDMVKQKVGATSDTVVEDYLDEEDDDLDIEPLDLDEETIEENEYSTKIQESYKTVNETNTALRNEVAQSVKQIAHEIKNQLSNDYLNKNLIDDKSFNICVQIMNDIFNYYISGYPDIPEEYLYHDEG